MIAVLRMPEPSGLVKTSPSPGCAPAFVIACLGSTTPTTAYPAFMSRDITRDDMRHIVRTGLEQTHGSYRLLLGLFNMAADDYKRFLGFLKQHDCHLPFQRFRALRVTAGSRAAIA